MGVLAGWTYRKSLVLKRASGAVTNYQMKLLVGESSGASGEQVDCAAHCKTDFSDLRFTKADGTTLLDYWIESKTGTTPNQLATIWIEFDSIGTGNTTFYMYYGNAGASAYSNGDNTFLFFDDFSTSWNNPVKWYGDTASGSVSSGIMTLASGTKKIYSAVVAGDIKLRSRCWIEYANYSMIGLRINGDTAKYNIRYFDSAAPSRSIWQSGQSGAHTYSNSYTGWQEWVIIELTRTVGSKCRGWQNGSEAGTGSTTQVPSADLAAHYQSANSAPTKADWVFISRFADTEPTWESFGAEVNPTTPAPTTLPPTTLAPTTVAPTTLVPTTLAQNKGILIGGKLVNKSILFGRLVQ